MARSGWIGLLVMCGAACGSDVDDPAVFGPFGKGDFYGNDDRQQILDASDPRVAGWAGSIAIVVNRNVLTSSGSGRLAASVPTLGEKHDLCSGERFADEPVLGFCSSYLVGPDLVATAGHCLQSTLCEEMAFVFDFHEGGASGDVSAIPTRNVFTCAELVARQYDGALDYALVRLDRPATGRTPFALQAAPPAVGARVALLGFPSGILAKVDVAGKVVRVEGNRIRTSVDSFPGHSGGVMIDMATGRAFGVHVEGSTPSYVGTGTCMRAAGCAAVTPDGDTCQGAVESSVDAFSACCGGSPPGPVPTPATCVDRCGSTAGSCACDLACVDRGDCCGDFADVCEAGSTTRACLGGGAPCAASTDCSNAMCSCDSEHAISESFVVPGQCTQNGCADLQQLCADACENMEPVVANEHVTLGWWMADCESL